MASLQGDAQSEIAAEADGGSLVSASRMSPTRKFLVEVAVK